MATVTVTSKGQITIPAEVRKDMGLKKGDRLELTRNADTGEYALSRKTRSIKELFGMFKYEGPPVSIEQMDQAIADHLWEDDERIKREWRERH